MRSGRLGFNNLAARLRLATAKRRCSRHSGGVRLHQHMDAHDSVRDKVDAILREMAKERADALRGDVVAQDARAALARALVAESDIASDKAEEMAFHLLDWNADAAFLVAVILYPERFTQEELGAGVVCAWFTYQTMFLLRPESVDTAFPTFSKIRMQPNKSLERTREG